MPYNQTEYLKMVRQAIERFQYTEFFSDKDLSLQAGLSPTMVSKIKKGTTMPKLSTLKKLKKIGIKIPNPVYKK